MYNDGVTLLYFNTTGTKGGSEELKNFLEYLEKSEPEKAAEKDAIIAELRAKLDEQHSE